MKGTVIMSSSIADAFQKALSKTQAQVAQPIPAEWDDETTETKIEEINTVQTQTKTDKRVYFQTTNNVTRATFNYVRDNPGLSRIRIAEMLEVQGYKKSSTTSLLGQMVKQGMVRENGDALFVTQAEYTPLKSNALLKKQAARKSAKAQPAPAPEPVKPKTQRVASPNTLLSEQFDVENFVGVMTLRQAKEVYDYLRKIFG